MKIAHHPVTVVLLLAFGLSALGSAEEKCPTTFRPGPPLKISSSIRLEVEPGFPVDVLQGALEFWQSCPSYGSGFPRFVTEGDADFSFKLRLEKNRHAGGYCAYIYDDEVVVFLTVRDSRGDIHSCGSLAENLAHELGHLLDLADTGRDPACQTHLMGSLYSWKLDARGHRARSVTPEVCRLVDERWLTWDELDASQAILTGTVVASRD